MLAIAYLEVRQILGGRKLFFVSLFLAMPVLLSFIIQWSGGFEGSKEELLFANGVYLFFIYPLSVGVMLSLLYGTALLSNEVEHKTLTYLFTRPIPRWQVILSKYAAAVVCLWGMATVSFVASWAVLGSPGGIRYFMAFWVAILAGIFAYTAIFAALGVILPRRAMVAGLLYAVVFEGPLSFVPAVVNMLTVSYYLRSIIFEISPVLEAFGPEAAAELQRVVGGESLPVCGGALLLIVFVTLGVASLVATFREYVVAENPA